VKEDVENPVKAIFDAPMGSNGGGEGFAVQLCR
jgi:hypothetical protein